VSICVQGRTRLVAAILALLVLAVAVAAYFGGWKAAHRWFSKETCGWIVRGEVTLDRDLLDCGERGLRIAPFAVLDCAGHEIRGRGPGTSSEGLRLNGVTKAEVRNCRVSGFARGVRIRGGSENRIIGNRIEGNERGIDVAGKTSEGTSEGHVLQGNEIRDSAKDAIHLGGSARVTVHENVIQRADGEGLSVESCEACRVTANTFSDTKEAAIDVKSSSRGVYEDNVIRGAMIKVRGASIGNVFTDNELFDSGFVFAAEVPRAEKGASGAPRAPRDNRVVGGQVLAPKVCFRFTGASDNRVEGVAVRCRRTSEERPSGTLAAERNTVDVRELGDPQSPPRAKRAAERERAG